MRLYEIHNQLYLKNRDLELFEDIAANLKRNIDFFSDFVFHDMQFSSCVSNSHYAPDGKPRNWSRDKNLPMGYPGWKGLAFLTTTYAPEGFMRDWLWGSRMHTGSGGGSKRKYQYEIALFAEEWPGLAVSECYNKLAQS